MAKTKTETIKLKYSDITTGTCGEMEMEKNLFSEKAMERLNKGEITSVDQNDDWNCYFGFWFYK